MCFGWRLRWCDGDGGDGMFQPNWIYTLICEFGFGSGSLFGLVQESL
jgi:hypothetical protein